MNCKNKYKMLKDTYMNEKSRYKYKVQKNIKYITKYTKYYHGGLHFTVRTDHSAL